MRRTLTTTLTALAVGGLLTAGGALAAPGDPAFATSQVWFSCDGQTTRVSNVNGTLGDALPGWTATAPTASVTSGAGCGNADPAFLVSTREDSAQGDGAWSGTFTGNIDAITVELHTASVGTARALPGFAVSPRLFVDGAQVPLSTADVEVTPVPSATGASSKVVFTLSGLGIVDRDEAGDVVPGASTTEHTVTLQANHTYVDASPVGAWLWGTSEVPAGLVFNPARATGPVDPAVS